MLEDDVAPPLADGFLAYTLVKHLHPAFFVPGAVGVEINDFAVCEADAETFFDKHIALLFLGKAGLTSTAAFARGFFLRQNAPVINEF